MSPDSKGCMDRNECLDMPCMNGATCINLEPRLRFRCICPDGFWGESCELVQEGQTLKLSMGALAAILVCLLIILSEQTQLYIKLYMHISIYIHIYLCPSICGNSCSIIIAISALAPASSYYKPTQLTLLISIYIYISKYVSPISMCIAVYLYVFIFAILLAVHNARQIKIHSCKFLHISWLIICIPPPPHHYQSLPFSTHCNVSSSHAN